jgi:hypothetical protein
MVSKFTWTAYIPAFIFAGISVATVFLIAVCFFPGLSSMLVILIPAALFAILALLWLAYGEMRTKIIRITLEYDHLVIKRYYGLGKPETIYYADIDGFTISILPATYAAYEYLYLMRRGKKVAKLSQFYHKNYVDLKSELQTHIKDLGIVDYNSWQEIKDIFG